MSDFAPDMLTTVLERERLASAYERLNQPTASPKLRQIPRDPEHQSIPEWVAGKLHLRAAA